MWFLRSCRFKQDNGPILPLNVALFEGKLFKRVGRDARLFQKSTEFITSLRTRKRDDYFGLQLFGELVGVFGVQSFHLVKIYKKNVHVADGLQRFWGELRTYHHAAMAERNIVPDERAELIGKTADG